MNKAMWGDRYFYTKFKPELLLSGPKKVRKAVFWSVVTFRSRFKDEDITDKFRDVGKAAEDFGKSLEDCFKKEKGK